MYYAGQLALTVFTKHRNYNKIESYALVAELVDALA